LPRTPIIRTRPIVTAPVAVVPGLETVATPTRSRLNIPVIKNIAAYLAVGGGAAATAYAASQAFSGGGVSNPTDPRLFGAQFIGSNNMNNFLVSIPLKNGNKVTVNKAVAANYKGFLDELWDKGVKYKSVGGYSSRKTRTPSGVGNKWSRHALGLAIDIDPSKNQYKGRGYTGSLPKWVGPLAAKYGLEWGADFGDSMHFSYRQVKVNGVAGG
jgi:hypothetical protein